MGDLTSAIKPTLLQLTPKNYRQWIREIRGHAEAARIWHFIDPDSNLPMPTSPAYPTFDAYQVMVPGRPAEGLIPAVLATSRPAVRYTELSQDQKEEYKIEVETFKYTNSECTRIQNEASKIRLLVVESARTHIPDNKSLASVKDLIKALATRFKRDDHTQVQAIHDKYRKLMHPPHSRDAIEKWVAGWENLRDDMIDAGVDGRWSERDITLDFLKTGHSWAPNFCMNWALQKKAAKQVLEFSETTAAYREAVDDEKLVSGRNQGRAHANGANFQGQDLGQQSSSQNNNNTPRTMIKEDIDRIRKKVKDPVCLCGEKTIFHDCPYLLKSSRTRGWKEDSQMRQNIRDKIMQNYVFYRIITRFSDIGILDGITDDSFSQHVKDKANSLRTRNKKLKDNEKPSTIAAAYIESADNSFYGAVMLTKEISIEKEPNPIYYSVVYDSGCNQACIWDKSRFVGEIKPYDG